jgi:RHS repeat-associated protein
VIESFAYTHDGVGNRLTKVEVGEKTTYTYDAIYRLLESLPTTLWGKEKVERGKVEEFTYDPVGNRLKGPKKRDDYTYNQGNQLTLDRWHIYEYDKNGNLVKKTGADGGRIYTYAYDYENRLTEVEMQSGDRVEIVAFRYDPFGRRISKSVGSEEIEEEDGDRPGDQEETGIIYYFYDNEDILTEYNQKGKVTARYVHGLGIDEPLAVEQGRLVYYYHADGLGSIVGLTNERGRLVQKYDYDSFGNMSHHWPLIKQPYTYTGREYDPETSLYYYRARYYDARSGRFISKDPIGFATGDINLYVYVENNPVNLVDPTGKVDCTYSIIKQTLTCITQDNETISCNAASGNNNPNDQCIRNIGPIPTGDWNIGVPGANNQAPLTPRSGTNTYGRFGFFIHGWGTTRGCIAIYSNSCRDRLTDSIRNERGGTLNVSR